VWALITCTFNFHCISRGSLIVIIRLRCAVLVTTYRVPCSRSVNYPSIPDSFTNKIAAAIKMKCLVLLCNMKHPYFYPIITTNISFFCHWKIDSNDINWNQSIRENGRIWIQEKLPLFLPVVSIQYCKNIHTY
jgi:hypothetical protein